MRALLTTVMIVATSPALALSCMKPDVTRSFTWWSESEKTFTIAAGTLTPLGTPPKGQPLGGKTLKAPYRFAGRWLGPEDDLPIERDVTVTASCLGPWCGRFPIPGAKGVMALEHLDDGSFGIEFGPCPGGVFPEEDAAMVKACMAAGACPSD